VSSFEASGEEAIKYTTGCKKNPYASIANILTCSSRINQACSIQFPSTIHMLSAEWEHILNYKSCRSRMFHKIATKFHTIDDLSLSDPF
jgi:hypothetical protein